MSFRPALITAALVLGTMVAHATPLTGSFAVTVSEGVGPNGGFDTKNGNPYSGANTASATFTYNGPLNFSNMTAQNGPGVAGDQNGAFGFTTGNVSGYSGTGSVVYGGSTIANFSSLSSFLTSSSGSASNFAYGSYYTFNLGTLLAGTVLTITHDDGVSLFQGNTQIGLTASGPTSSTTENVTITSTGNTILRYARENGTPSILQVSSTAVTPEPSSLALLGTGLLGMAGMIRRRLA